MMEDFIVYSHAIASLGLWALLVSVLSFLSVIGRSDDDMCACGNVKRDYSKAVYRRARAFANAIETSGPFIAAVAAAILAGAAPFWVNLLASVFIVARVAMAIIHIGTTIQPLRSVAWMIGWVCILVLAVMATGAAIL